MSNKEKDKSKRNKIVVRGKRLKVVGRVIYPCPKASEKLKKNNKENV